MMKFLKAIFTKSLGQASVEYALLLMIAALSATAVLALDDKMKTKIHTVATDFDSDLIVLPPGEPQPEKGCHTNEECLQLSPPVAKFKAPSPNYKGREIKFTDESYDVDGYVEHWRWTIDGKSINQSRKEAEADGGLVYTFRHPGTYNVSLYVFDNDGLISNIVQTTITVVNRPPTLSVTVENEEGHLGSSVTVRQGCKATFYTTYTDPDLPFDALSLRSIFTDQSGVRTEENTAPHEFTREFVNLGNNTYFVSVTDENGANVSGTVSVNVVANPSGNCTGNTPVVKPTYKIKVTGAALQVGNIYYFKEGTKATLSPVVTWGTYPQHNQSPYYWIATSGNTVGEWHDSSKGSSMNYPYPSYAFQKDTKEIRVTGMARDTSAISNAADPSQKGMSNMDTVILAVLNTNNAAEEAVPIISLNGKKERSDKEKTLVVDLSKKPASEKYFDVSVESVLSAINDNTGKEIANAVAGVRWKVDGTWRPSANENGAVLLEDKKTLKKEWYYPSKINSPDTVQKPRRLIYKEGAPNIWVYELEVISKKGTKSLTPAIKEIKLTNLPDEKPKAVCNPTTYNGDAGQAIVMNASLSTDKEGTVTARWSLDNFKSASGWQKPSQNVPNTGPWILGEGTHKIYLEVRDSKNQTAKAECTAILKKKTNVSKKIRPELWYVEERVRFASNSPVPFINRSNYYAAWGTKLEDIHYTAWTTERHTSDAGTTPRIVTDNYVGASTSSQLGDNPHTKTIKQLLTDNTPAAYRVFIMASDKDGTVLSTDCLTGNAQTHTVGGKSVQLCAKATFYFRFGEQVSGGGVKSINTSNEDAIVTTNKCYKIAKSYSTWSKYANAFQEGGSTDTSGSYDVRAEILKKLRGC